MSKKKMPPVTVIDTTAEVVDTSISIAVPLAVRAARAYEIDALAEFKELEGATVDDDEDAALATEELKVWVRKSNEIADLLAEGLAPLKEPERRVRETFAPASQFLARGISALRGMLEAYAIAKRNAHRKALAAAEAAATLLTSEALTTALQAAEDAAPTKIEGLSFVITWKVKRIAEGLLPFAPESNNPHYWTPDRKQLDAIGRKHKGDKPPVIPGVVWEEDASSRVRT